MVKLAISYFYRIRFFDRSMIPLSTAVWDPKWYSRNGETYFDSRGVVNGLRFTHFMPDSTCNNLCHGTSNCSDKPETCAFLQKYSEMLDRLDYDKIMDVLENIASNTKSILKLDCEPTLVFMVYEPPYKPCSERVPLVAWFKVHGYALTEV